MSHCVTCRRLSELCHFLKKGVLPSKSSDVWRTFSSSPPTEEINLENIGSEAYIIENSPALYLVEQQVLPVPCLGTDRATRVPWPHHAHTTPTLWDWEWQWYAGSSMYLGFTLVWICICVALSVMRFKGSEAPWLLVCMCMFCLQQSCPSSGIIKESWDSGCCAHGDEYKDMQMNRVGHLHGLEAQEARQEGINREWR